MLSINSHELFMKKLLKVTSFTGLLSVFKISIGFVVMKVIAIYAGPSGIAMLGQLQSIVSGLNGVVTAPVSSGVVRYTAELQEKGFDECSMWWRASLLWGAGLSIIIIVVGSMLSHYISNWVFKSDDYSWLIQILVFMLPFSALGTFIISVTNGLQQFKRYISIGFVSVLISSFIMLILISQYSLIGALLAAVIQAAVVGVILSVISLRQPWFSYRYFFGRTNKTNIYGIGKYLLMGLSSALILPFSLIIIRDLIVSTSGWSSAGQWQVVWKISEVYLNVVTMALGVYFLPKLSSLKTYKDIFIEIKNVLKTILPIILVLALSIYTFRDLAIDILFTDEFRPARELFSAQLLGDIFKVISWIVAYPLLSLGKVKLFMFVQIGYSAGFVSIATLLIPIYGAQGAGLAYMFTYILLTVFLLLNFKKIANP